MKNTIHFHPALQTYVTSILPETTQIKEERKQQLQKISQYIAAKIVAGKPVQLTFICTHNSRRSHFGQIWAAVAAAWYGVENAHTYSGGTEATAFNPRAVAAAERAGFRIKNPGGDNPHYEVSFAEASPSLECFSKTYDDPFNPQHDFAAVMTCSDADENCPFIPGADQRFPVTYRDPKEADDTPEEAARYDERCRQIATEMFFLFSHVN
jgi:arsenate reductase